MSTFFFKKTIVVPVAPVTWSGSARVLKFGLEACYAHDYESIALGFRTFRMWNRIDSDRRAFKHTSWMWCSWFLCLFNRRVKRSDNVTGGWALAEERGFNETSGGDRTTPLTDRRAPAKSQRGQDTCHVQQVCIKVIVYTFIVLQKISVHKRILKKVSWFAQKYDFFSKCFLSSKSAY